MVAPEAPRTEEATMSTNPFDDEEGEFCVLINDEGQYSLWPTFRSIPHGWAPVGPRGRRKDCLDYIDANWIDMRPTRLVEQMNRDASERSTAAEPTPPGAPSNER
jgi:uncharacterized protein YbdZ (MbtH family)